MNHPVIIRIDELFAEEGTAKLVQLPHYATRAVEQAGEGNTVTLTGPGPVWLYLYIAHALHGKARSLSYDSPVTGIVNIFDHSPE